MNKREWIKTLKVGDEICDCRFKHSRVVAIVDEFDDDNVLFDRRVTVEDGHSFSAYYCCDPADHPLSEHPPE